jgi:hypothetical protein
LEASYARDGANRDTHRYGHLGWQQEEDAVDARAAHAADCDLDRVLGAARGLLVGTEGGLTRASSRWI